jgi:GTP cyclohydrolase FolE2
MVEQRVDRQIQKVGIRNFHQFAHFGLQMVLGEFSLYVGLNGTRGVHMSRFVAAMEYFTEICDNSIFQLNKRLCLVQSARSSHVKIRTKVQIGDQIVPIVLEGHFKYSADDTSTYVKTFQFVVQNITTCPCSLELCRSQKKGVPHIQRGFVTSTVKTASFEPPHLISIYNAVASRLVLPQRFVKRPDEHNLAVRCEENPVFVEDVVELVKKSLTEFGFDDFSVVAEHEESIHQHNAVAVLSAADKDFGSKLT